VGGEKKNARERWYGDFNRFLPGVAGLEMTGDVGSWLTTYFAWMR